LQEKLPPLSTLFSILPRFGSMFGSRKAQFRSGSPSVKQFFFSTSNTNLSHDRPAHQLLIDRKPTGFFPVGACFPATGPFTGRLVAPSVSEPSRPSKGFGPGIHRGCGVTPERQQDASFSFFPPRPLDRIFLCWTSHHRSFEVSSLRPANSSTLF